WRNKAWLEKQGLKYHKAGLPIPKNWPKEIELTDASGKVYMRLKPGQPVEIVGDIPEDISKRLEEIKRTIPRPPIDRAVPQERGPIPLPSQAGPVVVGPQAAVADIGIEELHGFYGDMVSSIIGEPGIMKTDDATLQRLGRLFRQAFPDWVIGPKLAYVIAIIVWHGKVIIWVIRNKGKQIKEWLKRMFKRGKKEDEKKLPEGP
ncbi:MAG: hypothetical protein ACUVV3_10305, partial [Dehalococcoidia bacterium]